MKEYKLNTRKFLSKGPVYFREIIQWPSNVPNELAADENARLRLELLPEDNAVIVEIEDSFRNTHLVAVVHTDDVKLGVTGGRHYVIIHSSNGDEIMAVARISVKHLNVRCK